MPNVTPGTALSALRLGVGVGAYATPNFASKLFGLDADANPQAAYLARLFGVRDIALATLAQQSKGEARQLAWQLGIACDAADVLAAALGGRNGTLSKRTAIMAGGTAAFATALGVVALLADE